MGMTCHSGCAPMFASGRAYAQMAGERVQPEHKEAEEHTHSELEEAMETSCRVREEAAHAEAVRQAECERSAWEEERKALVRTFLKEHGYSDVAAPRRKMLKTKYPIHTAAKKGDPKIVAALLEEGANPAQKNSAGQTAIQIVQQKNKNGSYAAVLLALGGA